jgi:hypothetical protein
MGAIQWERRNDAWRAAGALALGDAEAAEARLRPLLPAGERPRSIAERRALLTLAELELRRGRAAPTLDLLRRLELPPRSDGTPRLVPAARLLQAHALALHGRLDEARMALDQAHAHASAHGPRGLLWRLSAALGAPGGLLARHGGRADRTARARRASTTRPAAITSARRHWPAPCWRRLSAPPARTN